MVTAKNVNNNPISIQAQCVPTESFTVFSTLILLCRPYVINLGIASNFMKSTIQILLLIFLTKPSYPQDFRVNYENIEISIPGTPGPWLKHKGKYYCYFKSDYNNLITNHSFYILDKNGKVDSKVSVPEELQTFYYDLYIKNDTIFTTEYYEHHTFYLDEENKKWVETEKGIDLYYEDTNYVVYSYDFGEWGGVTWFKNKNTNKQYETGATSPVVNQFNNAYYLTTSKSVLKIADPQKLKLSKEPYIYEKAVLDENYFRFENYSTKGVEIVFKNTFDDYFNPKFSIITSYISGNSLYHLYKDSISTKIGIIQDKKLVPVYSFKSDIIPFNLNYDSRNPIQNNIYQTVQFTTIDKNVYGIIELNGGDITVTYFKYLHKEAS